MDVDDCRLCSELSYDPVDCKDVCMFHNGKPIDEIELCSEGDLTFEQELVVIESVRGK